jgi:hypothetical protein
LGLASKFPALKRCTRNKRRTRSRSTTRLDGNARGIRTALWRLRSCTHPIAFWSEALSRPGESEIERALAFIFSQGWQRISIKVVNARAVGGLVLVVSEFSATGSGPTAGRILHGKSTHALARVDDTWLSAMHTAINSAPTPVAT